MIPETRSEQYLASIIGEEVELPVPQSRIEHYLNIIAQNGVAPSSAGLINYDPDASYPDGSIGKEVHDLDGDVSDLKSEIDGFAETAEYEEAEVISVTPSFTVGAFTQTGVAIPSYDTFQYTQKIAVQENDVVCAVTNVGESAPMRWVCAYNGDTVDEDKGNASDGLTYTVPSGVNGVVLTVRINANVQAIQITRKVAKTATWVRPIPMGYMTGADDLSDGEQITLPITNVKNDNRYIFNANITTFDKIIFSKEPDMSMTVDGTNITIANDGAGVTLAHGLTIGSNISLMVANDASVNTSIIRLSSDGAEFDYTTGVRFLMDEGAAYVKSDGSTLTECRLSWVSRNINAPIWIFGDSYISWYPQRWAYYAARDGYLKCSMFNGYAGQASAGALGTLKRLLAVTKPKIVVWCMGMNDPDTTEVNASWKSSYDELVSLSEKYGFEIVLYTVPTTPTMNNNYKNAIVRDSGYRYIEADLAVRIDAEGHWVTGALDVDNVHPTPLGAIIIYYRVLADLPEIMSNY